MSAIAILFGIIKKVDGSKNGIGLSFGEMGLDSGSIKELFKTAQKESKVKVTVEVFQDEMFDEPKGETDDDDPALFKE